MSEVKQISAARKEPTYYSGKRVSHCNGHLFRQHNKGYTPKEE